MDMTKNEQTQNNNNMNYDNITRCPDCNLISSLNLTYLPIYITEKCSIL